MGAHRMKQEPDSPIGHRHRPVSRGLSWFPRKVPIFHVPTRPHDDRNRAGERRGEGKKIVSALEGARPVADLPRFALPWRIRISMRIRIGISAENGTPRLASNTRFRSRVLRKTHTAEIYREPGRGEGGISINCTNPSFQLLRSCFYGRPSHVANVYLLVRRPPRVHGEMCLPFPPLPRSLQRERNTCKALQGSCNATECPIKACCQIIQARCAK